jgi:hypothetical protein
VEAGYVPALPFKRVSMKLEEVFTYEMPREGSKRPSGTVSPLHDHDCSGGIGRSGAGGKINAATLLATPEEVD